MKAQSLRFGTEILSETISRVDLSSRPFKLYSEDSPETPHTASALIIATGASARRLNLAGEEKYWQNGISACAVCDGAVPIFRKRPLVVIGGGDSAAEEAMFLTKYGSHVTVLVRKAGLRASKTMANRLLANPKVTVRFNTVAEEVTGESGDRGLMTGLKIKNVESGEQEHLDANGLFYAVGHDPATKLFENQVNRDEDGYIVTKPGTSYTSITGVFAAGDVQDKRYRQAITSAGTSPPLPFLPSFTPLKKNNPTNNHPLAQSGSGCIAALEAEKFLAEEEHSGVLDGIDGENQAKKPEEKRNEKGSNGEANAPEYRSNPLL